MFPSPRQQGVVRLSLRINCSTKWKVCLQCPSTSVSLWRDSSSRGSITVRGGERVRVRGERGERGEEGEGCEEGEG